MKTIVTIFFIIFLSFNLQAATGTADTYTVTMKKVELCSDMNCSSATVVGTGSQAVDIASLSAPVFHIKGRLFPSLVKTFSEFSINCIKLLGIYNLE